MTTPGDEKVESAQSMESIGINLTIASDVQPESIGFRAYKKGTFETILLDGESLLTIQPTLQAINKVVNIGKRLDLNFFFIQKTLTYKNNTFLNICFTLKN